MKKMKCKTDDYTFSDFPATRKEVFFDCYREHFSLIFRLGILCLAISFPVFVIMLMRDSYIVNAVAGLEAATGEQIAAIYYAADSFYGLLLIMVFTLFGALFGGVVQICRQMLWGEPVFFGDDFKNGCKNNAVSYALFAFSLSGINYLLNLLSVSLTKYVLFGLFIAIILPVAIWHALQGIYYKIGLFASIKNGVLYYIKTVPVTLALLLFTVTPFWLVNSFITFVLIKYIVLIVLAILYVIPLTMCWMLYASHIFDRYVNKAHYPEIYRKGMRPENQEKIEIGDNFNQ